ncbi:G patch domain-containing protein 4 [Toxorhynchites rutilus septentrionalis]|uniref:G patch domain-containing protein 4 n=1 Tax=Toxorhynchites rutilus septentrionalis TaxID=329112 RepID=UPI002478FEFD|nr:G patch domain-containing protein 4 [Toxorhynchites rutilus septentrionalis]
MDFAKNVLLKFGWKEGDGLGKNSDGIAKPIKASFKFNSAGLGADPAKDLTNNWWDRVYSEASGNLEVDSEGKISQKEADAVEISNKSYSVKKLKQKTADGKANYGGFLRASTLLTNIGKEEDLEGHVKTEDIEFKPAKILTDEELFAACEGRTAHKGARHGLNLSGKLARIEAQNNKLLDDLQSKSFEAVIKSNDWQQVQKRKKSKKKKHNENKWIERHQEEEEDSLKDMIHNANYVVKKNRKKLKAEMRIESDLVDELNTSMGLFEALPEDDGVEPEPGPSIEEELDVLSEKIRKLDHNSVTIKKKGKKKKKLKNAGLRTLDDEDECMDPTAKHQKDYKKKQKQNNQLLRETVSHEVEPSKAEKPKKLLKSDSEASDEDEDKDVVQRINEYRAKMKSHLPKIKVSEPTDETQQTLADKFKEKHENSVKRVGRHKAKRKKSKRKQRQLSKLADDLEKHL